MRILGNAKLLKLAVAAAAIVAIGSSDALARSRGGWGSYGSYSGSYASYGSYGSYGSAGSYGYSVSYGSSGSYGSYGSSGSYGGHKKHGGLFARWHARKAAKHASSGSYGSYGSYGSSGSSGGYAVSYGSSGSYGSHGSSGSYGGYAAPVEESYSEPSDAAPATPPQAPAEAGDAAAPSASATEATIWVNLPADAKVFVNDRETTSTGPTRHFVSRGLESGMSYSYQLRVEYQLDGKPQVEDKLVRLHAGESVQLAFGGADAAATAKTELKLHVPAEARVTLAGAATGQTGEDRTYTTSTLAQGQKWDGYVIRVELERDGQKLVEEKTLSIEGGQTYELSFEFADDSAKVASIN
jgi:uncharacterized protein (TIGR03000 family)